MASPFAATSRKEMRSRGGHLNALGGLRTKVWLPTVGICCRVGPVKINMPPHCKRLYFKSLTYHSAETYPLVSGLGISFPQAIRSSLTRALRRQTWDSPGCAPEQIWTSMSCKRTMGLGRTEGLVFQNPSLGTFYSSRGVLSANASQRMLPQHLLKSNTRGFYQWHSNQDP